MTFKKNTNVLRIVFAAKFYISNFILHASAIDIIWETGFVMAQLWPSFSPSLAFFFFFQPLLSSLLILRFVISGLVLGHRLFGNFFFPSSSRPAQTLSKEPTTLLDGCLLASSFTPRPRLHLVLGPLLGKGFYLYGLFSPSLGSIFLRYHEIKNLTRNKCHVSVY